MCFADLGLMDDRLSCIKSELDFGDEMNV